MVTALLDEANRYRGAMLVQALSHAVVQEWSTTEEKKADI
jgi:hypothetical protein